MLFSSMRSSLLAFIQVFRSSTVTAPAKLSINIFWLRIVDDVFAWFGDNALPPRPLPPMLLPAMNPLSTFVDSFWLIVGGGGATLQLPTRFSFSAVTVLVVDMPFDNERDVDVILCLYYVYVCFFFVPLSLYFSLSLFHCFLLFHSETGTLTVLHCPFIFHVVIFPFHFFRLFFFSLCLSIYLIPSQM